MNLTNNAKTVMYELFDIVLWIIMLTPLYLSLSNALFAKQPVIVEPLKILEPLPEEVPSIEEILEPIEEDLGELPFIWELEDEFADAFRSARMYLGPNQIFRWKGNKYHTLYKEELDI